MRFAPVRPENAIIRHDTLGGKPAPLFTRRNLRDACAGAKCAHCTKLGRKGLPYAMMLWHIMHEINFIFAALAPGWRSQLDSPSRLLHQRKTIAHG